MTEFICGVQNTGKSTLVYKRIKNDLSDGKKVILIVPDQEALSAEAELAEVCRDIAVYNLKVYGFSRLADDVFRTYGGICCDYVDKTGATLALFLSLCSLSPALSVYKNVSAADRALLGELLETIRGFKRQGISPSDIEEALKADLPQMLKKKMSDIALIYASYVEAMKRSGDDPDDDTARMYEKLVRHGGFAGYTVYIDSFISFTGMQLKVIELMMRTAEKLTVTVGAPLSDKDARAGSVLSPVYDTYKRLSAEAKRYGEVSVTELKQRYAAPELNALEEVLRGKKTICGDSHGKIRVFSAKTCYEEADMIAADIRKKLMSGARCRDIAIITEDLQNRKGVIDAALEKYGIPYFMSVRTDARQKSLFRFIQSAVNVYTGGFRPEDVTAYIRSGLIDLPDTELDLFGDYIRKRNIKKAAPYIEGFAYSPDSLGVPLDNGKEAEKLARINEVRAYVVTPLYDFCRECEKCVTASDITDAIIRLVGRAGVIETLRKNIKEATAAGDADEAQETAQLWNVFLKITSQIKTLCRDLPMRPSQYSMLLDTVLSQTTIGRIPTSIDEVTVGESGTLRVRGVKHVYVIGANEGEFPAPVSDCGIIDDKEKEYLTAAGMEFETDTEKETQRKAYDFYRCACISSETATFSYCRIGFDDAAAGKEMCAMLGKTLAAFPGITPLTELSAEDMCATAESAFEYYAEHPDTDTGRALRRIFEEKEDYERKLKALSEPICKTDDAMTKETADMLVPKNFSLSPTRLEAFAGCPTKHYCGYFLKLGSDDEIEFNNLDFGNFVHLILKQITDEYIKDAGFAEYTDGQLSEYTYSYISGYCNTVLGIDLNKKGFGRLNSRIKRLCAAVLPAEREILNEFRYGKFRPYATELQIKRGAEIAPYPINAGEDRTVQLYGKIDRVDVYQENGSTYIKLVDYKSKSVTFRPSDVRDMEGVQLFIYMIDAVSTVGAFPSPVPAALYYMDSIGDGVTVKNSEEFGKTKTISRGGFALNDAKVIDALGEAVTSDGKTSEKETKGKLALKSGEELDELFESVKNGIAKAVTDMARGDLSLAKSDSPCEFCSYTAFCRYTEKKDNNR